MRKKTKLRILAWVMAFCMILTGLPNDAWRIMANGNEPEPAQTYYLWGTFNETTNQPESLQVTASDEGPEGLFLLGKFISDGSYQVQEGDDQLALVLNNATVSATGLDFLPNGWALSGTTQVNFAGFSVNSEADVFPAYTGTIGTEMDAMDVFAFYGGGRYDGESDEFCPYDWTITGNHVITGFVDAMNLIIREGATLTIGAFLDGENPLTVGSILRAGNVEVAGSLVFGDVQDADKPSRLEVYQNAVLQSTGSIQAPAGANVFFGGGADCNEALAGAFYEEDAATAFMFPIDENGMADFLYDGNGKWLATGGGEDPFPAGENQFIIEYDDYFWDDVAHGKVFVNGSFVAPYDPVEFEKNKPLTFTLQIPEERKNENLYVEIDSSNGWTASNFWQADAAITVTNNAFTFTPDSGDGFIVRIWWSDFDKFGGDDTEFTLNLNCGGGSIDVNVEVAPEKMMIDPAEASHVKRIYSKSAFTNAKLTLTFTPEDGRHLDNVNIWIDDQGTNYRKSDLGEGDVSFSDAPEFQESNGIYTYTFDSLDMGYVSVWAWFEDDNQGMSMNVGNNQYYVDYDECMDQGVRHATVKANNSLIPSREYQDFEKNVPLSFVLHPHEARYGCVPIVEINVSGGEFFCSQEGRTDEDHHLVLTKNGNDYSFSFTPATEKGFGIMVWWSDYDHFGGDGNEFTIETRHNGSGSVLVSPGTEKTMNEPGEGCTGTRRVYANNVLANGGKINLTFTPGEEQWLKGVELFIGDQRTYYAVGTPDEDEVAILGEGSGFSLVNGVYCYEITAVPESRWFSFNADFDLKPHGICFDTHGDSMVEYRLQGETGFMTVTQVDQDHAPEITLEQLGNATSVTIKITPLRQDVRVLGLGISQWDNQIQNDRKSRVRLDQSLTYTFTKGDLGWENLNVEVIGWDCPFDGEYYFTRQGDGDASLANGLRFDKSYAFTANEPITFTVIGKHVGVNVVDYNGNRTTLNGSLTYDPDSNEVTQGTYSYVPTGSEGVQFDVFLTQEAFDVENLPVNHDDGEFTVEYFLEGEGNGPSIGGSVSLNVAPIRSATDRNRTRMVYKGVQTLELTLSPDEGFQYWIEVNGQDVTEAVLGNNNVYVWNVSEPWNIPNVNIRFEKNNQYFVRYDECIDGDNVRHATVTVNNGLVANEETKSFTKNQPLSFVLHPHESRIGCTPIVEIRLRSGMTLSSRNEAPDNVVLTKSGDDYLFTYTPQDKRSFEVEVWWSEYDHFGGREGEFTVETGYNGSGSVTIAPGTERFMDEPGQGSTSVRYVYAEDFFKDNEGLRMTFEPGEGYYVQSIDVSMGNRQVRYVTYEPKEPDEVAILADGSGFSLVNGVYVYDLTDVPARNWFSIRADYRRVMPAVSIRTYGEATVEWRISEKDEFVTLAQDDPEKDLEIQKSQLGDAESVTLRVTRNERTRELYGICINQRDEDGQEIFNSFVYLDEDDTYVLEKGEGEWPTYYVAVVNWFCPFDGEYVIEQRGPGELSLGDGKQFHQIYDFTEGQPIQFTVVGDHYKVLIGPNVGDWDEQYHENGVYSYQPDGRTGVSFFVYATKGQYDFEMLHPEEEGEFNVEYGVHGEPGAGSVAADVTPKRSMTYNERTRMILENVTEVNLTITPSSGYDYRVYLGEAEITDVVKANGNVLAWDVSDPMALQDAEIFFERILTPADILGIAADLEGKVGLLFYVYVPDYVLADEGAYVELTLEGATKKRMVSAAQVDEKNGIKRRRFAIYADSTQFNSKVNFRMYLSDGTEVPLLRKGEAVPDGGYNYSVIDYCNLAIDSLGSGPMVDLANALIAYGEMAQIYFDRNAAGLVPAAALSNTEIDAVLANHYAAKTSGEVPEGLNATKPQGVYLMLDAATTLRVNWKFLEGADPSTYTYAINGSPATVKYVEGQYCLEVRNIPSKMLADEFSFSISKGGKTYTWTGSTLSWAQTATAYADEATAKIARALYLYNKASRVYFGYKVSEMPAE